MEQKQKNEIAYAMEVLMKYKIEVLFLFKESRFYYLVRGKRNWRVYHKGGDTKIASRYPPSFIRYRCEKIISQNQTNLSQES